MSSTRWLAAGLIAVSLLAGTVSDTVRKNPSLMLDGYHVLAVDFHVHPFPLSWSSLAPWDLVLEAQRQELDAIAITDHNHLWAGTVGSWFSQRIAGPTVLVGEEIVAPTYHLLAIGINHTIDWRQPAAAAIDEVHRQGGVAIAAHPLLKYWAAFDPDAMSKLDGSEVLHPLAYVRPPAYVQFQQFYARRRLTAIGDSDFHGLGPMGMCRTYVFARDHSPSAILEAVRAGHTVVYDRDGRSYGDPDLIRLASQDPRFNPLQSDEPPRGFLLMLSRTTGIAGLFVLILFA
ncbi:MAG: PHP domain-containing protein [Terriglobales bacterium]